MHINLEKVLDPAYTLKPNDRIIIEIEENEYLLRKKIIEANLFCNNEYILTLGKTEPLNLKEIISYSFSNKKSIIISTILAIAATVLIKQYTLVKITNYEFIIHKYKLTPNNPPFKMNFSITIIVVTLLFAIILITRIIYLNQMIRQRKINSIKCSAAGLHVSDLANEIRENQILDIISGEIIPTSKINTPKIILISKYAFFVKDALKSMFSSKKEIGLNTIPHPIESRVLTKDEQVKFLKDICSTFCISSEQEILNCWNVNSSEMDRLCENVGRKIYGMRWFIMERAERIEKIRFLQKELRSVIRIRQFLKLIPHNIESQYFSDIYPKQFEIN